MPVLQFETHLYNSLSWFQALELIVIHYIQVDKGEEKFSPHVFCSALRILIEQKTTKKDTMPITVRQVQRCSFVFICCFCHIALKTC